MLPRITILLAFCCSASICQELSGTLRLSNGHTHSVSIYDLGKLGELSYVSELGALAKQAPEGARKVSLCSIASIRFLPLDTTTKRTIGSLRNTECNEVSCSWRPVELKLIRATTISRGFLDVSQVVLRDAQANEYPLSRYRYTAFSITRPCK